MDKPIILQMNEFDAQIISVINKAGLPAFLMRPTIEKIYNNLLQMEQQEFSNAKNEYDEKLKNSKEVKKNDKN